MDKITPNIIIVDDHDLFREGIKTMLELDEIARVIGIASNGKELLELLETHKPDIILMDIDMPVMGGIETTSVLSEKYPEIKVIALSMFGEEEYYLDMIEAGARGFILKSANKDQLQNAIVEVFQGRSFFSGELLTKLVKRLESKVSNKSDDPGIQFTDREIELMQNMCLGLSSYEIAEKMYLSEKTIENYRVKLMRKTGSKNSIGLVIFAIKNKLVEI